ncbi:MAG: DNA gyrase inhibitor YacG [Rhodoferax sp.]|uniref:DNA gyrase inhibitor YacG n=1 Tax=Rhodoferax sp. TaxID=50421 RepID=UPI0026215C86|nr:DNA gyrase inhibitor YacG [Rhodoferax sp.]MDD2880284.1 DNA gyrase inhibitor YacG [Rhodoferax sp.]
MKQAVQSDAPVKQVTCPTCGGVSIYAPSNPFRPFCSERCKQIDLGAWASERFTMPADTPSDDATDPTHV